MQTIFKNVKNLESVNLLPKLSFTLLPFGSYTLVFQHPSFLDIALIEICLEKLGFVSRKSFLGSYLLYRVPSFSASLQFAQLWLSLKTAYSKFSVESDDDMSKIDFNLALFSNFSGSFIGVFGPDVFIPFSFFYDLAQFLILQSAGIEVIYSCDPLFLTPIGFHAKNPTKNNLFDLF